MKRLHQREEIPVAEASTEITGGGGVGNLFRGERVQLSFVLSSQFKKLKTCGASEQKEGNVEYMIGLAVRKMHLEDRGDSIDTPGRTGNNGIDRASNRLIPQSCCNCSWSCAEFI